MKSRSNRTFSGSRKSPLGFTRCHKAPQGAVRISCKFNLKPRFGMWAFIADEHGRILADRSENKRRRTDRPRNLIWSPVAENNTIGGAMWKMIPTPGSAYNPNRRIS